MSCFQSSIGIAFLPALVLALPALPAQAAPVDCGHIGVLARVVTKDARVNFVAGRGERTPTCPSAERACQQKANVVPGDEVLTGATDGPYVCALFKSQRGTETTGWLPRTALEVVSRLAVASSAGRTGSTAAPIVMSPPTETGFGLRYRADHERALARHFIAYADESRGHVKPHLSDSSGYQA